MRNEPCAPAPVNHDLGRDPCYLGFEVERILKVVDLARDRAIFPSLLTIANQPDYEANAETVEALLEGAVLMLRDTANLLRHSAGVEPLPRRPGTGPA